METTSKAWNKTLREKVYMAKLAVLISIPRKYITHCPRSFLLEKIASGGRRGCDELDPQGVFLSERRTPFSRASCSRVIGMKEPRKAELACIRIA